MVMNIWSGFGKLEFHLHLLLLRRLWILLKWRLTVVEYKFPNAVQQY